MMTRKHFEAIAAIFANRTYTPHVAEVRVLVYDFADMCARENPNFNRQKFLAACGL